MFTKVDLPLFPESECQVQIGAPLCEYTSFRLGGRCPCLITCQTPAQLPLVIKKLKERKVPFILIGSGCNLLVSDEGVDCVVVRYASDLPSIEADGQEVVVSGASELDALVLFALKHSLEGLNYASGIPGTVGGAIAGNAGAFGKQVGDYIKSVTLLDQSGDVRAVGPRELEFSYRNSKLKKTGEIVLWARFKLLAANRDALCRERDEILGIRHQKHPDYKIFPCAGSFFRNIEPTSDAQRRQAAGWFLEQAGAKQMCVGGAVVFEKHANIIIKKTPDCRAQDVYELSRQMADAVKAKFNLQLVREVRLVGKFEGMPAAVKENIW